MATPANRAVRASTAVRYEIDGPMLRHGLQEMHGATILVPCARRDHPDPSRLGERYEQFLAATVGKRTTRRPSPADVSRRG